MSQGERKITGKGPIARLPFGKFVVASRHPSTERHPIAVCKLK
jgi:hypothetical protein